MRKCAPLLKTFPFFVLTRYCKSLSIRKAFFLIAFLFAFQLSEAQRVWIDSVKNALKFEKSDTVRYRLLSTIFYEYLFSTPDSSVTYAQQALVTASKMKSDL